ncbi:hypothetical protein Naga_100298g6 [Nannochloropsis gaditana]|uniref:Uncharacterized protein n=1 Tax=Nannochloropsis gaditana TaxID=72520 RepID=W7T5F0_9STRA|nr:hypothetical protein Naga_100298g6 [Nannochloropsis gaditana]
MALPCTTECCAPCCGIFSIIGFLFLIILGIIVDKQPIFVHGVTEPHRSAVACYGGAGIYAGTLALCVVAWMYDKKKKEHRAATAGLLKEEEHVSLNIQRPGSYDVGTEMTRVPA